MASIHLQGFLDTTLGGVDVGGIITWTHLTNTGDTIETTKVELIIPPNGFYSIDVNFGQIRIDYTTEFTKRFVATVVVNGDSTATTIPELLNAFVPPTDGQLLIFQDLLADTVAAKDLAEAAAAQITTTELIGSIAVFAPDQVVTTSGYLVTGDGGTGGWKQNGVTGQTISQTPAQLGDALLNDANGNQWSLIFTSEINVATLGVSGDVSDDKLTVLAGFTALSAIGGGNLKIDINTKLRILSDFDIPQNCGLVGDHLYLDTTDRDAWPTFGSRIRLASTATIGQGNGAKIKGMLVYRDDMTFPPAGLTVTEVALYAGTAITVKSAAPYIGYSTFLGFDLAVTTVVTNTPRGRMEFNNVDCTSGFKVDLDLGAWTFAYNFCQPILSNTDADNIRTGVGFDLVNKSDWTTMIGCFAFNDIGFRITDSNSIKLISCMADHPTDGTDLFHTGTGLLIAGSSVDTQVQNFQSSSHESGITVNIDDGDEVFISNTVMWNMNSITGMGVKVSGGNVSIIGGEIGRFHASGGKGILANNANSTVSIGGNLKFKNIAVAMDNVLSNEFLTSQDLVFDNVPIVMNGETIKQIASLTNITPRPNEGLQEITGTTTIGTIIGNSVMPEKIITFIIVDGLTLNNGNIILNGAVNWVATAGSSITLQFITGNTWREISRNEQ